MTATSNKREASLSVEDCTQSGECLAGEKSCFTKDIEDTATLNFSNKAMLFGRIDHVKPILVRPEQMHSSFLFHSLKQYYYLDKQDTLHFS